jgi:hypothetical protein
MRKSILVLAAAAAVIVAGAVAVNAQTARGAAGIPLATKNFTPIEKAACGPFWGRWCGPFHHSAAAAAAGVRAAERFSHR